VTTAATLALIALIIFIAVIVMNLVDILFHEEVIPLDLIWAAWAVGAALLAVSWVVPS
jgi:hypothetical protein